MGTRLLEGLWAEKVLDGLLIETSTELGAFGGDIDPVVWGGGETVDSEAHNTDKAAWTAPSLTFIADRAEARLVLDYRKSLLDSGDRRKQHRLKSPAGFSDIYLAGNGVRPSEIVEAKSSDRHQSVRDALSQLLDYVIHASDDIGALTALFPSSPSKRDIAWLGNYGIGCVFRNSSGEFVTLQPSHETVIAMKVIWQPDLRS